MNMIKELFSETKKHKRRFNLLIFIAVVLFEMIFIFGNYSKKAGAEDGWLLLFYNMPIMNCLFFPAVIAGFTSRLMDIEHKGDMLKCLYTFTTPVRIFYTKYLYGTISILVLVFMQCCALFLSAEMLRFPSTVPHSYMLLYCAYTFLTCVMLFSLHMILSYFFRNQAVGISTGLIGSFLGLFSSFLPKSLFQKILPWSAFVNGMFVRMDWDKETNDTVLFLEKPDFSVFLICAFWIFLLSAVSLILLKRTGVEENERSKNVEKNGKIMIHKRPVEVLKLKGSPAWIAFIIVPLISAIIGTINYKENLGILTEGWYSLWTQHTLFLCYFFMPVIIGIFTGCIWRVDHQGTNMNLLMTHQRPSRIVLGKFGATCFITTISILWVTFLYTAAGFILKIDGTLPKGLVSWLLMGVLGAFTICAFQIFISLVIRNFILPIMIAFVGGFAGIGCVAKGYFYLTPFSLFDLAMNQRELGTADLGKFITASIVMIVLFNLLSILYLSRADVRTHE